MQEIHSIQVQYEEEKLEKLKEKVERIKANQQKFEPNLTAAKTHHEGNCPFRSIQIFTVNNQFHY